MISYKYDKLQIFYPRKYVGRDRNTQPRKTNFFGNIAGLLNPRCIKASFYIPENRLNFPATKEF